MLLRHTLLRLFLLYFIPLILIAVFFHYQYYRVADTGRKVHLAAVAENRASTLNLFLRERWTNLFNVIDDPLFAQAPTPARLRSALSTLKKTSSSFVDLGLFGARGTLLAYEGPYPFLQSRDYGSEAWFLQLGSGEDPYIVTDIYHGFRGELHFTIAVRRDIEGKRFIVRAALSPQRLFEEIAPSHDGEDIETCVVNLAGDYQLVAPGEGTPLSRSPYRPPSEPPVGVVAGGGEALHAYARLDTAPWILVVRPGGPGGQNLVGEPLDLGLLAFTAAVLLLGAVVLWVRARFLVRFQIEAQETEAALSGQLVRAAKLASVGELAAGIAHEINNPLAIIAEEVGMMQDLAGGDFDRGLEPEEMARRLQAIHTAVFRCRDITRKLLSFVRQTEVQLAHHDIHEILDEVVDGLLGNELSLSNIEVCKRYGSRQPTILTDRNQLVQVFVNLVRNALDAMEGAGRLELSTKCDEDKVSITVRDSGCGMSPEQLERIFMPFYTTKEPGKGTGLGLSVSFSIIRSLGGEIYVESAPGRGSCFRIDLPLANDAPPLTQEDASHGESRRDS